MKYRSDLIKGRRVTVAGMARTGMAVAGLLHRHGAQVFVTETKPIDGVFAQAQTLSEQNIKFESGGHSERALQEADYLVLSPGISPATDFVRMAQERSIPIFSEVEVTSWLCQATILAITGSNGKSTTTALVAHILNESGRKAVATGNIGTPFASDVEGLGEDDYAVVEVSSFQLEFVDTFHPAVSAILNITPDHLDRYGDFNEYAEVKFRIADSQGRDDYLVLNADDPRTAKPKTWGNPGQLHFSARKRVEQGVFAENDELRFKLNSREGPVCRVDEIGIPGPHNLANAAAAAAMCLPLGLTPEEIAVGLGSFRGIAHRLETVGERNAVKFINDSKATNVDSVYVALKSVPAPIILIMGGRDKGGDFSALVEDAVGRVKLLLLLGEAQDLIAEVLADKVRTMRVEDIFAAVRVAYENAEPGDTVLLSPGCASFDQFKDFEERGEKFKQAVREL